MFIYDGRLVASDGEIVITEDGELRQIIDLTWNEMQPTKLVSRKHWQDDFEVIDISDKEDGIYYMIHHDLDVYVAKSGKNYIFFVKEKGSMKKRDFEYAPLSEREFIGDILKLQSKRIQFL